MHRRRCPPPLDTALAPAAGTLLALAALAGQRASNSRPADRPPAPSGGVCSFSFCWPPWAGAALCVLLFTGTAAQALTALTGWLRELASGALALLDRFFRWLFSLFPAPETGSLNLPDPISAAGGPAGEAVQSSDAVLYVLAGLVLLAGVGAILWALRRGGSRTRSHPPVRRGRVVNRRSPRDTLAMLWSRLADRVRFQLTYLARRNTPAGVLVWLDRRLKRRRRGRRPGETCRAFLDRAAAELPGCAQELGELARCLDQLYFGGGAPAFSPQPEPQSSAEPLRLASRPPERPARH